MLEGSTDSNDLFNLRDIRITVVSGVSYSGDGGKDGLIGGNVVGELDGVSGTTEGWWCLNGGIRMWNNWQDVFLVRVVIFGGFVWVREADAGDICGSVFADPEEPCDLLLDSGVLLRCAY